MGQTNYFVEIRRRALEIDWRVPISIYDESDGGDATPGEILLNGRYLRIERDLLVVAPHDRGVLFHRYFDTDAPFAVSPLKLRPGQTIPMNWASMMVVAPILTVDSEKPAPILESVPAAGLAVETGGSAIQVALGPDFRLNVGSDTRLWLTEGARAKGWTCRLLRGSVFCEALGSRGGALRVETLRGQGRISGGALGIQMMYARHPDLALVLGAAVTEATRWEMGGFGYSLNLEKPALAWTQSGGSPDTLSLDGLSGRLNPFIAGFLEKAGMGQGGRSAEGVAKPYRAPKAAPSKPSQAASAGKGAKEAQVVAAGPPAATLRNGQPPAIAPITVLDKPIHSIAKFDGDIELRLSVDQGTLICRRLDLAGVEGSGTGSLVLKGKLSLVNSTLAAVMFDPPSEQAGKPQPAGVANDRRPVMVTLFARIGGRLFETNMPLEQFLSSSGPALTR